MSIPGMGGGERARRVHEDADDVIPGRATTSARPGGHDAAVAAAIERTPVPTDHLAFLAAIVAPDPQIARDAQVCARLDAFRDAVSGPYDVGGQQVAASPMFRMLSHPITRQAEAARAQIGKQAGLSVGEIGALNVGQGSRAALVKMTQGLIDAGKLPSAPADLAGRIKTMQWTYGIGMDCAGYSKEALRAAHGRNLGFYPAGVESFRDLDSARSKDFARVGIEKARPGDLITLDAAPGGTYGHNVVVYGNQLADEPRRAALVAAHGPAMAAFLSSPGPHRVLQVDSSWGAGSEGAMEGGYRRDTWLYDAATKHWASFEPGTRPPALVVSKLGPSDDMFHAVYRPR